MYISANKLYPCLPLIHNLTPLPSRGVNTFSCSPASNKVSAITDAPARLIPWEAT